MAKQVFYASPLNFSYIIVDNGSAGNTGDQNSVNPPTTNVAGAGGYDNTPGNWGNAFGGAQFQNAAAVAAANGAIPDFAVAPTKVLTNASTATVTYKNPAKETMNPPGTHFKLFLDSIYVGKPLKIVETGCMRDLSLTSELSDGWSTLYISRWVKAHPECEFHSVDLNIAAIELAHQALEADGLAPYCSFHLQDSLKFLGQQTWIDFAFLDSCDGLQHGLDEFRLAASTGCRLIVMDDYSTKAAWAIKEAKELGWEYSSVDRYSVLRRS